MKEGRKYAWYLLGAIALTSLLATLLYVPADFISTCGVFAITFMLSASLILGMIFLFELTMEV